MRVLVVAALLCALLVPAPAEDPPAPPVPAEGTKPEKPPTPVFEDLHGLRVDIVLPRGDPPAEGRSLMIFLHGRTGTGKDAAEKLAPLALRGFVVAAPSAKTGDWTAKEVESVKRIAADLVDRYGVDPERRHAAGFWTGANFLPELAFEDSLRFRTATWINSSWGGGSVPKRAKEDLRGLFLWGGSEGPSRVDRYVKAAELLAARVRISVAKGEAAEEGLGRGRSDDPELPVALLPFWTGFLEAMEGRFVPGGGTAFDWASSLGEGVREMVDRGTGGLVYVYDPAAEGEELERMRVLQNEVFYDRILRHFGDQLIAIRLEKGAAAEVLKEAKVKETPAIVVYKKGGGEVLRSLSGEITARSLTPLLRAASPDQAMPK